MSATAKSWAVAASIGAVEALKDQGVCRWNHALRFLNQHAKNSIKSYSSQAKKGSLPASSTLSSKIREEKMKKSEESLRTVMYLSCWGPN